MTNARFIIGDTRDVLRTLPDNSVDLVMTSPPFLALRSYLPADHPDKHREMGSEPTPGEFIDGLLDVVVECRRVLAPHGSIAFELGDTYAGSGGAGGDYNDDGMHAGQPKFKANTTRYAYGQKDGGRTDSSPSDLQIRNIGGRGWPEAKSLCLIPQTFAWALAYGRNPHTGRTIEPWRVRNIIRWCRPNPPVGALGDKFRPATSEITVACMSRTRYFDLDAVRVKNDDRPAHVDNRGGHKREGIPGRTGQVMNPVDENGHRIQENPAGAPPLDYWVIPTSPYPGSHYATYPEALCVRPIQAMCPQRVCTVCGEPSRRIVAPSERYADRLASHSWTSGGQEKGHAKPASTVGWDDGSPVVAERVAIGWTDCGHDAWRNGVVLDPFGGSGTTGAVAIGHGRDAILIDLDERNAELARQRLGMFLTVERGADAA